MVDKEDQIIDDEVVDNDVIEDEIVEEQEPIENSEGDEVSEPEINQDDEEDDEEDRIVTIGDSESDEEESSEEEDAEAPGWVKKVRKVNRKQEAEIKRLKKQLEEATAPKEKPLELGPEPTLKSCNYDDQRFKNEILEWNDRKQKVEEQKAQKAKEAEELNKELAARQEAYVAKKKEYGFKDFGDAEEIVSGTLSQMQQGIIIDGAKDSALVVYALGKNPKTLEKLASIKNPIQFTVAMANLERDLKVKSRKAPAPEKRVTGAKSGGTAQVDEHMAKLEKDAERTGDRTKIRLYRKELREKGRLNG